MKKIAFALSACILAWILFADGRLSFAQSETDEMRKAAEISLREFVLPAISEKISSSMREVKGLEASTRQQKKKYTYGFLQEDQIEMAELEKPFQLHILKSREVHEAMNKSASVKVNDLLYPTNIWYYPIVLGGKGRCILMLEKDEDSGEWKVSGFGGQPLAYLLGEVKRQWPERKGYTPKLIQSDSPYDYLFTVPEMGQNNLTSLSRMSNFRQLGNSRVILTDMYNRACQRIP